VIVWRGANGAFLKHAPKIGIGQAKATTTETMAGPRVGPKNGQKPKYPGACRTYPEGLTPDIPVAATMGGRFWCAELLDLLSVCSSIVK
jgi:hypothetical protein